MVLEKYRSFAILILPDFMRLSKRKKSLRSIVQNIYTLIKSKTKPKKL